MQLGRVIVYTDREVRRVFLLVRFFLLLHAEQGQADVVDAADKLACGARASRTLFGLGRVPVGNEAHVCAVLWHGGPVAVDRKRFRGAV